MSAQMAYCEAVQTLITTIAQEEAERIGCAAERLTDAVEKRDLFHIIGTGAHGSMAAEEMLWRVGGLACVNAILDPSVNLLFGANRSGIMDQTPCNCGAVLDVNGVLSGDTLIIVNSSGINAYSIAMAKECRRRGIETVAVTSKFGLMLPEPRKENLFALTDCYIDNHMPYGDAAVTLNGYAQTVGPASSVLNLMIVNMLTCQVIENLRGRGIEPPVWKYDACPGGQTFNEQLHERYRDRVKHL